jgi:N4-gp56 family major capsid protein
MTAITTATTNFDKMLVTLIQKRLEEELRAPLPHLLPGNFRGASFVKGTSNTMRFLRVADMSVVVGTPSAGTPPWLTEGTAPTAEALTIGYEEFSANQAGRVIQLTDVAMQQSPIDLLATAAEKVARNALETADGRVADVLAAGTNVLYAGTKTTRNTLGIADLVTSSKLRRAVASLKADNVPAFGDGYYRCIINPAVSYDFMEDTGTAGWMNAALYAGSLPLLTGELGKFAGVRFIESSKAHVFADGGTTLIDATLAGDTTGGAAEDLFTSGAAHGLVAGDKVRVISHTGGNGVVDGTVYYVLASELTTTTFQLSATAGGGVLNVGATDLVAAAKGWGKVNDVYSTTLFGPDAYAFGDWGTIESHITPPGGHDDPLHQSALVGWKGYFGAVLTDEAGPRYIRIESGSGL